MKRFENSVSLHEINATSVYKCSATSQPEGTVGNSQSPRRRVQGTGIISKADLSEQREVVSAFLMAWRGGDFEGLLTLLDPDLVVHFDEAGA